MGANLLTNISNALMKKEKYIGERLSNPGKEPLLTVMRQANKETKTGQDMKDYFKVKIRPSGGWMVVPEAGNYPAGQPQLSVEGYQIPRLITHTLEYSLHAIETMKNQSAGKVGETVAKDVQSFLDAARRRKTKLFTGRGGLALGRALAAGTSVTFTSSTDVPIRAVQGDMLTAFKATTSNDEREMATADTGTTYLGSSTVAYVNDVDYDNNTLTLSTSLIWSDDAIIAPYGASSTNHTAPEGLEALLDTVNDSSFAYDSEDDTMWDHTDTIYGLARATYSQLNVGTVSTSGYLTLDKIQRGVGKCVGKGAAASDLVLITNPKQFENLTQTHFGKVGEWKTMTMAGQDMDIFCVTGLGSAQVPVIVDYGIKATIAMLLDKSALWEYELPGGWDTDGGSGMFQKKNASSGQGHAASKIGYWNQWLNWASIFPNTSCIIYGLSV